MESYCVAQRIVNAQILSACLMVSFCPRCQVPVCKSCSYFLRSKEIIPEGLVHDNVTGYLEAFLYEARVTWMEKTVTSPFWTGLTLFTLGRRDGAHRERKRHKLHDAMYLTNIRVAYKGQLFSAPMDWRSTQDQLKRLDAGERVVDLPITGALLEKNGFV